MSNIEINDRKQFGVLVTKDYRPIDHEFQKMVKMMDEDEAPIIRGLIAEWVEKNREKIRELVKLKKGIIQKVLYKSNKEPT